LPNLGYSAVVTLKLAKVRARTVLLELEIEDGDLRSHLFAATGKCLDQLADGLLDEIDDELAQEFEYQRRRMDGGKGKRQISTQLRRSLDALDIDDLFEITESLKKACRTVLQLEDPAT
jgi:hypothetical protein